MKTKQKLSPLDQVKDDSILAQSAKQRKIIYNSDTLRIDQLHSKKQVSQNIARAINITTRDQDKEIHFVGNVAEI